jgi:hypothetical protein
MTTTAGNAKAVQKWAIIVGFSIGATIAQLLLAVLSLP